MRYILLFFLFSFYSFSQDPYYLSVDKSNGMPSNSVYDIFQDSKNFVWYATSKGICRIDGSQIRQFHSDVYASRPVSSLYEDCFGRIWYQDFNGNIFYIKDDIIHKFQKDKANGFLKFGFIDNKIFIASKSSINIYESTNFDLIKSVPVELKDIKHTIVYNNHFYIVGKQIIGFDTKGNKHEIKIPENHSDNNVAPLLVNFDNQLLIFSKYHNYYYKIIDRNLTVHNSPIDSKFIQNIVEIDGYLWICSTSGVYKFNVKDNSIKSFFPSKNISSVLKTKTNKYWFSTLDEGVFLVDDIESVFFKSEYMPSKLFSNNEALYFGNGKDEIKKLNNSNEISVVYKGDSNHYIHTAHVESEDQILIGSSKLVIKYKNKILTSPISVKDICKLDHKYYLISATSWSGVIYFDTNLKSPFDEYFKDLPDRQENGIHFLTIIDVEDGKSCSYNPLDKTMYFITNYGVKKYKNKNLETITNQLDNSFVKVSVVKNKVFCIEDNETVYEIKSNNKLITYQFPNNFKNSGIFRMRNYEDELFVVKESGVYSFNLTKNSITKIFDLSKNTEFIDITKRNGTYYIALSDGIISSKIDKVNPENIKLYLNQILVNSKPMSKTGLTELNSDQNNIEVNFNIASETLESNYKLYYRINNNPWESLSTTIQSIKLSSLSYGKHHLQILLVNGNEQISENIYLEISYPFWLKWWFVTLIVFVVFILLYSYFRYRISVINKRNKLAIERVKLEKHLNQSKLKALKSQMNPHFFFNALNTLQSYILDNDKNNAIFYLSKFSKLTRTILEMSDKDYVNLSEEITTLNIYLEIEQSRFPGDFNYYFTVDDNLKVNELYIPSLLLQPHIENAIKHGLLHKEGEKIMNIKFEDAQDYIFISIDDNGIGRKRSAELNALKNQKHKSFATESLQQRIDLINVNLKKKIKLEYIDKDNYKGTIVKLHIPKRKY